MNDITKSVKECYKGTGVISMIHSIERADIFPKLRLIQQNEFCQVKNKYRKLKYIDKHEMQFLWIIWYNFVLLDFNFEDKTKQLIIPTKTKVITEEHIGLKMLKQLQDESN